MKKNAGILGALAVMLAIFGMSNLSRNPTGGGSQTASETSKRSKPPSKPNRTAPSSACYEIQRRIQPLVTDSYGRVTGDVWPKTGDDESQWIPPSSCYSDFRTASQDRLNIGNLTFVIATAPNPVSTHLALSFDRALEIIQQAAQDNGYFFESSWLPWNKPQEYTHLLDQLSAEDAEEQQEKQPGVLVFRNPLDKMPSTGGEGGLVVFVVSDSPTGGINQQEFSNALAWIQQLQRLGPAKEIKVLGPTFSGSLPSLYKALHIPESGTFSGDLQFTIFSGGVSSETAHNWFKERLQDEHLGSFTTESEGDALQIDRFCKYITFQGYETNRLAFLSEDETAFGGRVEEKAFVEEKTDNEEPNDKKPKKDLTKKDVNTTKNDPCNFSGGPTYLYYPRDIATLRSAYEQQSIFDSAKQASGSSSVSTTLRGDLSESDNNDHDTVRSYGGQLTPLAQESVLLAIRDILKAKRIQFVVVRSSNSLDQVFLGQFFRRSLPETRIVMDGSDLLFRRGAEGGSLRGVMVLSSYPLLTWQQDWTSSTNPPITWLEAWISQPPIGKGESYRIFGVENAENLYIAARELLHDQNYDEKDPKGLRYGGKAPVPVDNYAPPAWVRSSDNGADDKRPATWLTVIGHRQFWPVAVLNTYTLTDIDPGSMLPEDSLLSVLSDSRIAIKGDAKPLGQLPVEFGILVFLCVFWSALHLLWCMRGSISAVPSQFRLAYFASVPRCQHSILIGFGSVLVASAAVVVAGTSGLLYWALGDWNEIVGGFILIAFLLAFFACWRNYTLPAMTDPIFTPVRLSKWRRGSAIGSMIFLVLFMVLEVVLLLKLRTPNRIPTFWRSVHVLSGVSPLLPQLFLLAGMYCWFWYSLRGLSLFGNDRPLLPNKADLKLLDGTSIMPMFGREQAETPTEAAAMPIGRSYLRRAAVIFPVVAVSSTILLNGRPWLRTLGERAFGIFMFFWITVCVTLILADTAQSWSTWRRLRVLLRHIDLLPVRRTLNALQGMSWRSVWAMSGDVLAERYRLISRQLEALRHLRNQIEKWVPKNPAEETAKSNLAVRIDTFWKNNKMRDFVEWYKRRLEDEPITNVDPICAVQEEIASIAGLVLGTVLIPSWHTETESIILDRTPRTSKADEEVHNGPQIYTRMPGHVLAGEEFFVLPYLGFIQNILGRIRTIVLGTLCLFVATTLAVSSYPFDPLPVLGGIFLAVFAITGSTVVVIYAGMHRDATLSYITDTTPGELGGEFWRQVFTFGIGPLIGLLTTLFPSITDFVVSWLEPSTQVIK
jgi:hypothetical protein